MIINNDQYLMLTRELLEANNLLLQAQDYLSYYDSYRYKNNTGVDELTRAIDILVSVRDKMR